MSKKPRFRVLAVDDEPSILKWLVDVFERGGYEVATAERGAPAAELVHTWDPAVMVTDMVLPDLDGLDLLRRVKRDRPDLEVIMLTGHGSVAKAVEAMRAGAFTFLEKPAEREALLAMVERAIEKQRLRLENRQLRRELSDRFSFANIVGKSRKVRDVTGLIRRVAPTDANVLILGASGTGKELVADAIHANSPRHAGPFIKVNCAAIPKDLMESELFGYRRGAFTGAVGDKEGLLKLAHGGSLLLDEIGEMPAALQTRLLRVLEEREFRPVGASRSERVDFRLICATNVDVDAAIGDGRLREDLYFRINTITIPLAPLRERLEDLPLLCEHLIEKYRVRHQRPVTGLTPAAFEVLLRHPWPGNVRELEHALERGILVADGDAIDVDDLPASIQGEPAAPPPAQTALPEVGLEELERLAILQALERCQGNKQKAARMLGLYRPTLYAKMKRHGLEEAASASGAPAPAGPGRR